MGFNSAFKGLSEYPRSENHAVVKGLNDFQSVLSTFGARGSADG